jgi:signal transduction histidine kinase
VRRRILWTIVAITGLAVVGFGVPLALAVARMYRNEARLLLQREATASAAEVPIEQGFAGEPTDIPPPDPGTDVAVYGPDGRLTWGVGPATADPVVHRAYEGDPADGVVDHDLVVALPLASSDEVVAVVRAAGSNDEVERRIVRADAAMMVLAAVVMASAVGGAMWQSRRITRPLDDLTLAARRLGDGDFTVTTPASGVAEIDTTADALNRTADRLSRLIARERAFSTDVSHQLRTPLTGLRLTIENARNIPGTDPAAVYATALDAIDRLSATTEDLLLLARDMHAPRERTDLDATFAALRREWAARLEASGRRLVLDAPGPVPLLPFSGTALYHVLQVLVANGVEHGRGAVRVTATVDGTRARLVVADEGPGLRGDPEAAFARRADRRTTRGIGLHLARTLVEAEGGSLTYQTSPPGFLLTIPVDTPRPGDA